MTHTNASLMSVLRKELTLKGELKAILAMVKEQKTWGNQMLALDNVEVWAHLNNQQRVINHVHALRAQLIARNA